MKLQWKKPTPGRVAAWICAPLLALLSGGMMLLGKLFAWRILWIWGLTGLLPGLVQTVLLALPIIISVCMIALSAFGVISALAGMMLHNLGAFVVLINSARILKNK